MNSDAVEVMPRLRKEEYSSTFKYCTLYTSFETATSKDIMMAIASKLIAGSPKTFTEKIRKSIARTSSRSPVQ